MINKENIEIGEGESVAELYLHVPFCVQKCGYCDFLSFPSDEEARERYVRALQNELRSAGGALAGTKIVSVFIGGGTPTVLSPRQLELLLNEVHASFTLIPDAEVSVEMNPGTGRENTLRALRQGGVNRLSIGCQAMEDAQLCRLGRIHTRREFLNCYDAARSAGFQNINVDLMEAIPGQSLADWERTLQEVADLSPEHISAYSLILEEGTPFYRDRESLELPDEETERRMYERTEELLGEYGYSRYEISNYAKEGFLCRHNAGYWTGVPYAGLGLGASSYLWMDGIAENLRQAASLEPGAPSCPRMDGIAVSSECLMRRFRNPDSMESYLRLYEKGQLADWRSAEAHIDMETITKEEQQAEFMILGLRMTEGVRRSVFARRFGIGMDEVYEEVLKRHHSEGLLAFEGDRVFLTRRGLSLSNYVLCDFL